MMDVVIDELSVSCCTTRLLELASCNSSEPAISEAGSSTADATGRRRRGRRRRQTLLAGGEPAACSPDGRPDPLQVSAELPWPPFSVGPLGVRDANIKMKTSNQLGRRAIGSANNNGQEQNSIGNNSNNANYIEGGNIRFQGAQPAPRSEPFFRQYLPSSFNLNQNHSSKDCGRSASAQKSSCTNNNKSDSRLDCCEQQVEQVAALANSALGLGQHQPNESATTLTSHIRRRRQRVIDGQHQNELTGSSSSLVNKLACKLQAVKLLVAASTPAKGAVSRQIPLADKISSRQAKQQSRAPETRRKGFLYLKKLDTSGAEREAWFVKPAKGAGCKLAQYRAKRLLEGDAKLKLLDQDEKQIGSKRTGSQPMQGRSTKPSMERILSKNTRLVDVAQGELAGDSSSSSTARLLGAVAAASFLALLGAIMVCAPTAQALQQAAAPPPFRSQQIGGPPVAPSAGAPRVSSQSPAALPQPAAGSLVANVNCNKIRGHVTLTPNLQGGSTVSTQISAGPPGEVYQWSVHQFPIKPGSAMCSCSALILGAKLLDLSEMHGNLPSDQEFSVQSSLNLFGPDSPVGHSLLLRGMKTGMVACATFLPTSRKSNYRAKFHTPLSGSVTIFQTAFGTSFISHLMYSNGTRRHSSHRFDLVRSSDDDIMAAAFPLSGAQAASASAAAAATRSPVSELESREFENELNGCKRLTAPGMANQAGWEPLLRNMSYQLLVSTENFGMRGRSAHVLPQIPFETFSSVYLVVYSEFDPNEPIACAPLRFVKPKTAAAKFQTVSVQGNVIFSQDSPYDPTIARVNLNLPNSDGHSYGIDELPMIIRRKSDTRVCPNIREIIYNPHHVEPSSVPAEGEATSDQYAVGDLSGKYGSLTGKSTEKIQVTDYNLPLFGPVSIVGRAMTVYSADGVAIACSNVELTAPMTTAFATFDFGIQGQFIFRQPVNDCHGDTYIYIEVSKPVAPVSASSASQSAAVHVDHNSQRTSDHNWHIHANPVDSGLEHLSTTECGPAGAHYNPFNTSTSSIYSRDCTPFNVLRCELGDLSSKMFTIDIPPYRVKGAQEPDIGKFFGTDIDLPLCGPTSIVNRSVVVHHHDFGHQRLACSTVIEFKPRSAAA